MALKYQFNKTELQRINKDLKIRQQALPTLKNKESALRAEIKKHKDGLKKLKDNLLQEVEKSKPFARLFGEFAEFEHLVAVEKITTSPQKIAGVRIPTFENINFKLGDFSMFNNPAWLLDGIEIVKQLSTLKVRIKIEERRIGILELARKKTTQKVNLYEKVQIPEFEEAMIKIKRYIEDTDNLDRASQKIVKKRKAQVL